MGVMSQFISDGYFVTVLFSEDFELITTKCLPLTTRNFMIDGYCANNNSRETIIYLCQKQ